MKKNHKDGAISKEADKEIGYLVLVPGCRCRCGHEWRPHDIAERPRVCPKCKSANWDRPKKFERKGA
jgi:predicted Zn-ribbon and HTH transcriptional regulator